MKDLNFFAHAKAKIHPPAKAPSDGVFFSQKLHKYHENELWTYDFKCRECGYAGNDDAIYKNAMPEEDFKVFIADKIAHPFLHLCFNCKKTTMNDVVRVNGVLLHPNVAKASQMKPYKYLSAGLAVINAAVFFAMHYFRVGTLNDQGCAAAFAVLYSVCFITVIYLEQKNG